MVYTQAQLTESESLFREMDMRLFGVHHNHDEKEGARTRQAQLITSKIKKHKERTQGSGARFDSLWLGAPVIGVGLSFDLLVDSSVRQTPRDLARNVPFQGSLWEWEWFGSLLQVPRLSNGGVRTQPSLRPLSHIVPYLQVGMRLRWTSRRERDGGTGWSH